MKKIKFLLIKTLALLLCFSMIPAITASAEQLSSFPVINNLEGNILVADANTEYVTVFEQDPATKLITATIQIKNGGTGTQHIQLNGVGIEISFNDKVAPYDPVAGAMFAPGKSVFNGTEFQKYCKALISYCNDFGSQIMQRGAAGGYLGVKLSCSGSSLDPVTETMKPNALDIAPGQTISVAEFYFMPVNGTDLLSSSMFSYEYIYDSTFTRLTTWIGFGSFFLQATSANMPSSAVYYVSPSAFKMSFPIPTDVVPSVKKVGENLTSTDGKTRVGDVIKYTITVSNVGKDGSIWRDVILSDYLNEYVVFDETNKNNTVVTPGTWGYETDSRLFFAELGDIAKGQTKTVVFQVTVADNAYGKDITNFVTVEGQDDKSGEDVDVTVKEDGDDHVVLDPDKSKPPEVDPITAGDSQITGKGEPGADIVVTLPDGTDLDTKVGQDGKWSVSVPSGKRPGAGQKVNVVQTEIGKSPSDPVEVTVRAGGGTSSPEYSVTFYSNYAPETMIATVNRIPAGTSIGAALMPANPTRSGYTFLSWNTAANGLGSTLTATTAITRNLVVYAQWRGDGSNSGYVNGGDIIIDDGGPPLAGFLAEHIPYMGGYPDNSMKPDNPITRAEVATIFFRLLSAANKNLTMPTAFNDVAAGEWYTQAINYLASIQILNGYEDGSFRPNMPITRAEFATVASRFDNLAATSTNAFPDIAEHWAKVYINSAYAKGWVNGYPDGTFKPELNITRAEVVKVVNTMLDRKVRPENIPGGIKYFTDIAGHWAYADIVEASNAHDYIRRTDGYETWTLKD